MTCKTNEAVALNIPETKKLVEQNGVVTLRADTKTGPTQEIHKLMIELGNTGGGIPFYAIYPGDGGNVITFDSFITPTQVQDLLRKAGPSVTRMSTAGVPNRP